MDAVGAIPAPEVLPEEGIPGPVGLGVNFPRRVVLQCSDTPAFVIEIVRTAVQDGNFVAVVGWPDLLLTEIGQGLEKVVAVPDPGVEPLNTVAVLCEGMDLVVYRSEVQLSLSPVRARPLLGKLRKGNAALLLVGLTAPSPHVVMDAKVRGFHGIGPGTGRIRGFQIQVQLRAKTGVSTRVVQVGEPGHKKTRLRVV
ncbi:hypothetical protein CKALI_09740 [Corynebacterium kalinowskii]|uniref:Uncharacterized protein n=2 Tax=Corynebacterium kalinowskii TaxID=2675216 RepID=A0A6B8VF57_9CORY|nr:hypothetical protein CKALI_09740 [Corynebacterium kalinowskii]